jgi:hypothetical protein
MSVRNPGPLSALLVLLSLLYPSQLRAAGSFGEVQIAMVRYPGGNWNPRPNALKVLGQEITFRTSVEAGSEPDVVVTLDDPGLFRHPILMMAGDQAFPPLTEEQLARLRHHNADFDRSVRRMLRRLFPGGALSALSSEHVLFRSFYRLEYPSGRNLRKGYLEGITQGRRVSVVYIPNDLGGALDRDRFGSWSYDLIPATGRQREMALRLGVNLVLYALCLHYKDDHVHIRYLMKKRDWRIRPPTNRP